MKCLNKLTAKISSQELEFLKYVCRWRGLRNECRTCAFYPEDHDSDSACELIKDSQRNRKIPIPDMWSGIQGNIEPKESKKFSPLPPEIVLKKMREVLDKCPKGDSYFRSNYVSEEECKDCPLFLIACLP